MAFILCDAQASLQMPNKAYKRQSAKLNRPQPLTPAVPSAPALPLDVRVAAVPPGCISSRCAAGR